MAISHRQQRSENSLCRIFFFFWFLRRGFRERIPYLSFLPFLGQLQIAESEEDDKGKYECVAENSVGTQYSYSAQLYVRGKRQILSNFRYVEIEDLKDIKDTSLKKVFLI